jgi:hypothetical protein
MTERPRPHSNLGLRLNSIFEEPSSEAHLLEAGASTPWKTGLGHERSGPYSGTEKKILQQN